MVQKITLIICSILLSFNLLSSQTLINSTYLGSNTNEQLIIDYGFSIFVYDMDFYKIEYTTLDVQGVLDTASGLLSVPDDVTKSFPLLAYQHGTINSGSDVPSNLAGGYEIPEVWASLGYISFAPDYIGMGESRGFHPYVHRATEASAAIDMMAAIKVFLMDNNIPFNDQLFITGYSQGGHAAAALQKELEENYNDEFPVTASAPMSGPYSISGVMNDFMYSETPYNFVAYVPNVILSYQTAYGNIFDEIEDVFKPEYVDIITQFHEENITLGELNQTLINMLTQQYGDPIPIKVIQDSVVANIASNPNHPMNVAMRDNDVHNWAPQVPTRIYYCEGDDQVYYRNAVVADSLMNALGAYDVEAINLNSDFDHGECVQPAIINAANFFLGYQNIIDLVDVFEPELKNEFSIFPNPAQEIFFISNKTEEEGYMQLFNLDGKLLKEQNLNLGETKILTVEFNQGLYLLKIRIGNSFFVEKINIIRE